ncbi:MAG: SIMPL domain-containing protein [Pseudomonadota bacterium]|nr:SIMPL domain-containing protein [Pseudomonadota bacterium]
MFTCTECRFSKFSAIINTLFLSFVFYSSSSLAHTSTETSSKVEQGHTIHFSVSENQRVDNDLVAITFRYVAQAPSGELVMQLINQKMQAAVRILKNFPQMETQTSQYQVRPVYSKKQIITHWQGQQNLTITTENRAGLPKLLAQLQPYLNYQSMRFHVSEETQKEIKDKLLVKALKNYQSKAKKIAASFGADHFQLIETRIDTPNLPSPRNDTYMRSAQIMSESVMPTVEGGKSDIRVHISGKMFIPH